MTSHPLAPWVNREYIPPVIIGLVWFLSLVVTKRSSYSEGFDDGYQERGSDNAERYEAVAVRHIPVVERQMILWCDLAQSCTVETDDR